MWSVLYVCRNGRSDIRKSNDCSFGIWSWQKWLSATACNAASTQEKTRHCRTITFKLRYRINSSVEREWSTSNKNEVLYHARTPHRDNEMCRSSAVFIALWYGIRVNANAADALWRLQFVLSSIILFFFCLGLFWFLLVAFGGRFYTADVHGDNYIAWTSNAFVWSCICELG